MGSWNEFSLKDIGWFRGAGVNKLVNSDEQSVFLVNYMDVYKKWQLSFDMGYQVVTAKKREIEEANLIEGDILFTPSSEKPIDIGHAGVVIEEMPNCLYSYHLIRYRLFEKNRFDLTFLSYLLNSDDVQRHFVSRASGSGIRYTLSLNDFRSVKIRIPDKPEQTAIANILYKVDKTIASVQNSIAAAERLKKGLMQNLLTGKMKPDGTFRTPEEFYIDNKFGKVPVGWEVKKVQELSIQVTDGEHQTPERTETGYYLLSARNIKNGYLSLDDVDYIPEKELRRIQKRCNPQVGDILISCSGTIGNVCIVPDGFIGGMVRSAALVKLNSDKIEPQFAELMFQSHYLQNQMKVAVASSVQGNIFQGAIKKLRLFYPHDKQERIAITERLCLFNKEIASMQDKLIVFDRLKKSLMQNLLTGKVIVRSK